MSLPWSYTNRLGRDVDRWHKAGYLDGDGRTKILADVAARRSLISLPQALAILGATLICFSAMTFVAANWQEMSKLAKLLLLGFGTWSAYGAAVILFSRKQPMFGHAAVLVGTGVFGAGIMLIAQMYHMEGNPPDAVLMWALGALLAGAVFQSGPALALSMLLMGLWSGWEMSLTSGVHWPFLIGWVAVASCFLWLRWRPGLHLSAFTISGWIISLGEKLPHGPHFWLIALIGFAIAAMAILANREIPEAFEGRVAAVAPTAANYGLSLGFIGLMLLQFSRTIPLGRLSILAIATLIIVIAVIAWAMHTRNQPALWISYAAFSAEILALYFKTLGTLIDTSLFFGLAGLLVIALSTAAVRLMKHNPALTEGGR
ncbi:MAG: DUF2157 domain-containing protein [Hyphomicrobiaceae bacterium]